MCKYICVYICIHMHTYRYTNICMLTYIYNTEFPVVYMINHNEDYSSYMMSQIILHFIIFNVIYFSFIHFLLNLVYC